MDLTHHSGVFSEIVNLVMAFAVLRERRVAVCNGITNPLASIIKCIDYTGEIPFVMMYRFTVINLMAQ